MSGTAEADSTGPESEPVSARTRLRPKSELMLPEEIRRVLGVSEGDEVEFCVGENGTVTVTGYASAPADHA